MLAVITIATAIVNIACVRMGMQQVSSKFFWAYSSPQMLLSSSIILLIFTQLEVKQNKLISFLSAGSLSVYLIHENALVHVWTYVNPLRWLEAQVSSDILFIMAMVLYAIILYIVIASFDMIRQWMQNVFLNLLERVKIYNTISSEVKNIFK